jgi:hemerythrin superfamily protein
MASAQQAKNHDAVSLLKADHRTVEELFSRFEKTRSDAQKRKLAEQICMELTLHTMIEEELFYPECQGEVDEDIVNEAYVEHDGAKMLIAEILAGSPDDRFYDAKVTVLSEEIKHHVKEEEKRDGMFAQAKKAGLDLDEIGERLMARKKELKEEFAQGGLPIPKTRSMKGVKVSIEHPLR